MNKYSKRMQWINSIMIVVVLGALAYEAYTCDGSLHRTSFWVECVK